MPEGQRRNKIRTIFQKYRDRLRGRRADTPATAATPGDQAQPSTQSLPTAATPSDQAPLDNEILPTAASPSNLAPPGAESLATAIAPSHQATVDNDSPLTATAPSDQAPPDTQSPPTAAIPSNEAPPNTGPLPTVATASDQALLDTQSSPTVASGGHIIPLKVTESPVYKAVRGLVGAAKDLLDDVSVPGLKTALSGVLFIIQTIEQTDENYDGFKSLESQLSEVTSALPDADRILPLALQPYAKAFIKQTAQIAEKVKAKIDAKTWRRILDNSDDKKTIGEEFASLSHAINTFVFATVIQNHIVIDKLANIGLLDRLACVKQARLESRDTLNHDVGCLPGTRVQVLSDIEKWTKSPNTRIYLLNGMAGIGKTTIAESVAQKLKDQNMLGASFFCNRAYDDSKDVKRVFSTISYLLAHTYPAFAAGVIDALTEECDLGSYDVKQQFQKLILGPASNMHHSAQQSAIYIVLDALDELADDAGKAVLKIIYSHSSQLNHLHFFVTGRPNIWQHISLAFTEPSAQVVHLHHVEADIVTEDIKLYLTEKLQKNPCLRNPISGSANDWPPASTIDILTQEAGKLFIFAFTVYQFVSSETADPVDRLQHIMDSIVAGQFQESLHTLDALYMQVLEAAFNIKGQRPRETNMMSHILHTILLVYMPQSISCINELLGYTQKT
ncbi:hypothetical protein PLICRDRAFT_312682, partial [Plicaturopsis crispa FD-325 SS-3]